ncbi:MAG: hypothetical protein FJ271_33945 [Planctomycetes bacterium]|nr:hypothetical protein [Planctomycetota bacterium]
MDNNLTPRLLDHRLIDRAYPLVRNILPCISLERWSEFAKPHLAARSPKWPRGLMTIQNAAGYILGLFSFEVRDDLHSDRTLLVDNVIVPDMPGHELIWTAIVTTSETLALMNGCRAIRIGLAGDLDPIDRDRTWLVSSLAKAGYVIEGVRATRRVSHDAEGELPEAAQSASRDWSARGHQ